MYLETLEQFHMRFINPLLLILLPALVYAQHVSTNSSLLKPPAAVHASDGTYDKFVLIRWDAVDNLAGYRLFRSVSPSGASMQELTKAAQKSTWFCDYSAEKGRDYFYAVVSADSDKKSALSHFDKGFLRKDDKVAQEDLLSANTPDKVAAGRQVFVLVSELKTDTLAYPLNRALKLSIELQNIFEESTPRTDVRVFLSADTIWDFDDALLASRQYSGFPGNLKVTLNETLQLPPTVLPGDYYLLVTASPEGNILNAKTGTIKITIYNR